jgi:DNA-binding NarL/FixJ family response regulator
LKPIRILLADDHPIVRKGLRILLQSQPDLEVVAEAGDGREAVDAAANLTPDVIVMDVAMPLLNGIDATSQIVKRRPESKVIILSMYSDEEYLIRALTAGAKGYLLKESAEEDLLRAVQAVSKGDPYFSPSISKTLLEDYVRKLQQQGLRDSYDLLTEREKEILQLLAHGRSNKEVATLLNVSTYTVETHRNHIMQKLDLHNTAELVLYAVRKKLVS